MMNCQKRFQPRSRTYMYFRSIFIFETRDRVCRIGRDVCVQSQSTRRLQASAVLELVSLHSIGLTGVLGMLQLIALAIPIDGDNGHLAETFGYSF